MWEVGRFSFPTSRILFIVNYEKEVFDILLEAGDRGLEISKIARHVHHEVNSLFEKVDYEDVYKDVRRLVNKESRNPHSFVGRTQKRGCYRLNRNSGMYMQLLLHFED